MPVLELDGVETRFGDTRAVADLSLSVDRGEVVCLLGPSGCGKSTTLRTVAGLESPAAGRVRIDGEDVTGSPPDQRDCSLVFQDWALFPNKTVLENVTFGPKMQGTPATRRRERAHETLSLVEMDEYAEADPTTLSGGQKQRVALARSLALDPSLLLLDEPLSNLDRQLRETMQVELLEIQAELGTTMLYVTHDQDEAFTLADRIGLMRDGELVQVGPPEALYDDPVDRFVESFLGATTLVDCAVTTADDAGTGRRLRTPFGEVSAAGLPVEASALGDEAVVSVRPEAVALVSDGDGDGNGTGDRETDGAAPNRRPTDDGAESGSRRDGTGSAGASADATGVGRDGTSGAVGRSTTATAGGSGSEADARRAVDARATVDGVSRRGGSVRYRLSVGDETVFTDRPVTGRADVAAGETVLVRWFPDRCRYFSPEGDRLR